MPKAYYNEIDPKAAAWLRELINRDLIADGDVDERSIEDVIPAELVGYTQCHFFAGVGVWSYALRQSGWPDSRRVWTGSCPCQPFSAAGKGKGTKDNRHLWPELHRLIKGGKPEQVFGEQVEGGKATGKYRNTGVEALWAKDAILSYHYHNAENEESRSAFFRPWAQNRCRIERKGGSSWLNLVQHDMEAIGYTLGSRTTAACGFGAPQQRKRLYWMGDASSERCREERGDSDRSPQRPAGRCTAGELESPGGRRRQEGSASGARQEGGGSQSEHTGELCGLADTSGEPSKRDPGSISGKEASGDCEGVKNGGGSDRHSDGGEDGILANPDNNRSQGLNRDGTGGSEPGREQEKPTGSVGEGGRSCHLANAPVHGHAPSDGLREETESSESAGSKHVRESEGGGDTNDLAKPDSSGSQEPGAEQQTGGTGQCAEDQPSMRGPTNGFWRDADWIFCRDGKWRAVEPGTFPLADGAPARVGRLRGYGNAIVAQQAIAFIESYMEIEKG